MNTNYIEIHIHVSIYYYIEVALPLYLYKVRLALTIEPTGPRDFFMFHNVGRLLGMIIGPFYRPISYYQSFL